jgi:hypothetical protein
MSYPELPCAHCNQPGHKASRCKELGIPPDGEIIKPLPGQNDVDDDECHKNLFLWCEESDRIPSHRKEKIEIREILGSKQKYYKRLQRNLFRALIGAPNFKINTSRPICVFR